MEPAGAPEYGGCGGRPEDFVQSVGRAMRVLEVVARRPDLPVKTIARLCALNISTTYHLLRTLSSEGYVRRRPDGTYSLGDAVARRFHDLMASLERPRNASPVLLGLAGRVAGLTSYLTLLKDERLIVVEVATTPGSPSLDDFQVGLDVQRHAPALGGLSDAALDRDKRPGLALPVVKQGRLSAGIAVATALVPGHEAEEPTTWALSVACWGDRVPPAVCVCLASAARDLAARPATTEERRPVGVVGRAAR
jgi:DNA-binding IclR family transcriptional regulator